MKLKYVRGVGKLNHKGDEMKRTNIHLKDEQRQALKRLGKKLKVAPAEIVRRAIDYYLWVLTGKKQ